MVKRNIVILLALLVLCGCTQRLSGNDGRSSEQVQPVVQGDKWVDRFLALSDSYNMPYTAQFERSGGAGDMTHFYEAIIGEYTMPEDNVALFGNFHLRAYTFPFDEQLRSVELYKAIPGDEKELKTTLAEFLDMAGLCIRTSLPAATDKDIDMFTKQMKDMLSTREAAVFTMDGWQCIAQVTHNIYKEGLKPMYTLFITPAAEVEEVDGRPTFLAFQRRTNIMLNELSLSGNSWDHVDISGHDMGGYLRFFVGWMPLTIVVYTDEEPPYAVQSYQGYITISEDDYYMPWQINAFKEGFATLAADNGFERDEVMEVMNTLDEVMPKKDAPESHSDEDIVLVNADNTATLLLSWEISRTREDEPLYRAYANVFYHNGELWQSQTE